MYELEYEAISATNFKDTFELHNNLINRLCWQSTAFAQPPIELVVRLSRRAFIQKLHLRSKPSKQIVQLDILIADVSSSLLSQTEFAKVAKAYNVTSNETIVNVNRTCRFIKFVVGRKQDRREVSIDVLRILGSENILEEFKMATGGNRQRTDKLLIELGTRIDTPQLFDDVDVLPIDQQTRITIKDMLKLQNDYIRESDFNKSDKINKDLSVVLQLGRDILIAEQKKQWALAKEDFKQAKAWDEQLKLLRRKRDKYDEEYETSRYQDMIQFKPSNSRQDEVFAQLVQNDKKDYQAYKLREETDVQRKRAMINQEYEKAKGEAAPWWQQDVPTVRSIQDIQPQVVPPKHKPKTPKRESPPPPPSVQQQSQKPKSRQLNKKSLKNSKASSIKQEEEEHDFSNRFVYNEGDADMEMFIEPLLKTKIDDPDGQILKKYDQLQFLNILGSRAWLAINKHDNWRQRQAAAMSVLSFIQNGVPEKYHNGKSKLLFLALMQFARICCRDKVLQIYFDGLKILGSALAPPICGTDVTPTMINKALKDFVPILLQKVSEMNSRAKEMSLDTLISVFCHPAADINILLKEVLRVFKEDALGKLPQVDKLPTRIVWSRNDTAIRILQKLPIDKNKHNIKQILDLMAIPSLHNPSFDVRVSAVDLIGALFRHLGEPMILTINDAEGIKPNLQQMVHSKIDQVRQQMKKMHKS